MFEISGLAGTCSYNLFFVAFTLHRLQLAVIYGSLTKHFPFGTAYTELNQKFTNVLLYFQWRYTLS